MNKLAVIAILVIAVFLAGCAANEIGVAGESKESSSEKTTTSTATNTKTATTTKTATKESAPVEEEPEPEHISVTESKTGESVTFKKLGDPWRDKEATEKCDMNFPFECSRYSANSGIVYLTIKNQDYSSKADEVTLTLDGETCDPANTFIETGHNKAFECFVDPDVSGVSGSLEIKYYVPTTKSHRIATGSIAVRME
ncbi:MAG: hypothetical protein KKD17_00125 [Nanoarchaeota archaeon]|nr:hypothetical protein [Nanoarchaeota archaeon]